MTTARVLYLARYRVPHACMALQFDHNLIGIDRTVVASPVPKEELWPIFERYNIDTSNFDYVADEEVLPLYPQIEHWVFPDDYRGNWLRQQAVKLAFLDYLNYDCMLMHDPDTFMVKPYQCIKDGVLNFLAIHDTTHSRGYYQTLVNALGIERQTKHCFVTELVPVLKEDITALRETLEQRHNKHWLDAIIDSVPLEFTVEPWKRYEGEAIRWFSEYEFLGNWAMSRHPVTIEYQRRFEYDSMDKIGDFINMHNAICDAVPDLSLSVQYDWEKQEVVGFNHYMNIVNARLQHFNDKYNL